ncbi:MAG TPA: DUF1080 domain-containing protein, partial [Opitutaceae bacterium]|nr:DUF1080 domain-containing protein [Opitutaceae bacterium]
ADSGDAFLGRWALTIPTGGAGWLEVKKENGKLAGSLLWGGGSVLPVASIAIENDVLTVTRAEPAAKGDAAKKSPRTPDVFTGRVEGDTLKLTMTTGPSANREFTGKRIPPLPPKPNLARVKFGAPVTLFNGRDLTGWRLIDPKMANAWTAENGVLANRPPHANAAAKKAAKKAGETTVRYGNLRTDAEYEDFNLKLEVSVPEGSNGGVYLRGIYEIQILDSYGKPLDSHNMGALYSRVTPSVAAEKPAGEWQTLDMTLVDRHVTVILNGKTIIDNQPALGCTGGAMWSDQFRPGPIFLQGDHGPVSFRNITLRPVVK